MVDAATILTSAGVAVVITLGLEYAAKPRLEVRKERILEASRRRRDLLDQLVLLAKRARDAARWEANLKTIYMSAQLARTPAEELALAFDALRSAGEQLQAKYLLDRPIRSPFDQAVKRLAAATISLGYSRGLDPEWQVDGDAPKVIEATADCIRAPWWRRVFPAYRSNKKVVEAWLTMMGVRDHDVATEVVVQALPVNRHPGGS